MKALTLYQPWASFVALGLKTIETRSWGTNYRGPLAIHAARMKWPQEGYGLFRDQRVSKAYRETKNLSHIMEWGEVFPTGTIVAICQLVDCLEITPWWDLYSYYQTKNPPKANESLEGLLGDYTPGRYAWLLEDVQPLEKPIPARGQQRVWDWEVAKDDLSM
ncbi:MAG: ASCH domain-containing protein [Bellilinea sp.]